MTISTGDILKIVATLAFSDSHVVQNVYSVLITGAGGPWDPLDVISDALDYIDALYTELIVNMDDSLDGTDVDVYVYDPIDDDFDFVGNEPWSFVGTDSGSQMPRGVAGLLTAPTTDPDVNAKKYMGGLTEDSFANGQLGGTILANLVDFGGAWVTAFVGVATGANFAPGCWSVKDSAHYSFRDAFAFTTIPAYQRRRKRGVGI